MPIIGFEASHEDALNSLLLLWIEWTHLRLNILSFSFVFPIRAYIYVYRKHDKFEPMLLSSIHVFETLHLSRMKPTFALF